MKKCMGCMEDYDEKLHICPYCNYEENTPPLEVFHMMPGSILRGRYIVGKTLGYGGFGVTYLGYDAELERKVAIKEYLPAEFSTRLPGQTHVTIYEGEKGEQFTVGVGRFLDEAKTLARFQNTPGIVHIFDSFLFNDTAYIVMEYIEGESLKKIISRGKMEIDEALKIIITVAEAMQAVHTEGIIHRDIAPDNIMIGKDGSISLIDFGAARFATTSYSKSLSVLIKQGYAPVEQYQSKGNQGTWSDVYALSATLYTMITGEVPQDSMERNIKDTLKPVTKYGVKVSRNVENAILNALNIKAEERTQNMKNFLDELQAEHEIERIKVKKEKKDIGKWPIWAKAVTGGMVALIVAFVVTVLSGGIRFKSGVFDSGIWAGRLGGLAIVPDITNKSIADAELIAAENHIQIQIVGKQYSGDMSEGTVLAQDIAGDVTVSENYVVSLVISGGQEMVFVPSLVGYAKEDAIKILEEAGLLYEVEEVSGKAAPGAVISQSEREGDKVAIGSVVRLQISNGVDNIDESQIVQMPDLCNAEYEEAQKILEDLNLYWLKENEVYDLTVAKGGIVTQSIPAGNDINCGQTVTVVVSLGKEQKRVPDVQYKTETEGKRLFAEEGVLAKVTYESSNLVAKGNVISQSIEKDTLVDIGTTVSIVVSTGNAVVVDDEWSEWVENIPADVSNGGYEIEEKVVYSSRNLVITESIDPLLESSGWTKDQERTEYGNWSEWSAWFTTEELSSDVIEVQSETQYRYRDNGYIYDSGWDSSRSDWTVYKKEVVWSGKEYESTDGTTSDLVRVNSSYVVPAVTHINYCYQHQLNTNVNRYAPPGYINSSGQTWKYPTHQYITSTPLTKEWPTVTEYKMFEGPACSECGGTKNWYLMSQTEIVDEPAYTMYVKEDGTYKYYYRQRSYGDWTMWSTQQIADSSAQEEEIRTAYRCRQRYKTVIYMYYRWSDWTDYSDVGVSPSEDVEVRTKKMYRYKYLIN